MENTEKYQPELGQLMFGQPSKELKCTGLVESSLRIIQNLMQVKYKDGYTPFDNFGKRFKNEVFECNAYSWDFCYCEEELCRCGHTEQTYNFKWKDFEVSWYKYLGRGMSMNREISDEELLLMVNECMTSISKIKTIEQ